MSLAFAVTATGTTAKAADASELASRYGFENVTEQAGLDPTETRSWGSSWGDFDDDGDPDLFENRHGATPRLWENAGASFRLVSDDSVFAPDFVDRHGCSWGEANGDGRPDLYCTHGADQGRGSGPNQLFIQTATGFQDQAGDFGVRNSLGRGRTPNWLDFDTDGDLDLFVGNERRLGHESVMFRNLGNGFSRAQVGVGEELATQSSSWADWDRDGDPDLLVLQLRGGVAYRNVGGRFQRVRIDHVTTQGWRSGAWGDFNVDGWPDLHLVNDSVSLLLRNHRGRFLVADRRPLRNGRTSAWLDLENDGDLDLFVVQGATGREPETAGVNRADFLVNRLGGSWLKIRGPSFRGPTVGNGDAVSVADFDLDGRQDVFVTNGFGRSRRSTGPSLLLRNVSQAANWARLDLTGSLRNPWGLGTRITVILNQRTFRRQITDGFHYRQQSDVSLVHIGMRKTRSALVRVRWPDGRLDCASVRSGLVTSLSKGTQPCEQ